MPNATYPNSSNSYVFINVIRDKESPGKLNCLFLSPDQDSIILP